jgi:phage terminase small subunit
MPNKSPDIPVPKDPRHLKFADYVLNGDPPAKAYGKAGYNAKSPQSRATAAGRLLKNVDIARYMEAVRQEAAKGKVLTLQDKREFLARIVMTPLMSIDPRGKDGDLIRKYKMTTTEAGGMEEIEKLDPLKAIDLDNKLSGDDPESNATAGLAAAIAGLGAMGGTMSEKM